MSDAAKLNLGIFYIITNRVQKNPSEDVLYRHIVLYISFTKHNKKPLKSTTSKTASPQK